MPIVTSVFNITIVYVMHMAMELLVMLNILDLIQSVKLRCFLYASRRERYELRGPQSGFDAHPVQ